MFLLHRRTGTTNENLSYQRGNRGGGRKPDPAIYRETKAPAQLHRHRGLYKNKYTKQAEQLREANRDLQQKIRDVMENRSERNRWIRHFTKFATLDTLDRKAVVQLIQTITVYGKDELAIRFNYEDEYQKAKAMAEQVQLRKAG